MKIPDSYMRKSPATPSNLFATLRRWPTWPITWGIPLIIDSTCATPALMRPLAHGADIVIHSLTKSITSGGMAIGGALISRRPIITRIKNDNPLFKENFAEYVQLFPFRDNGPAAAPLNALFALNDLRTLRSKMDLVSQNCQKVAEYLSRQPRVYRVDYLGLPSFSFHALAKRYMALVDSDDGRGNPINRYGHLMGSSCGRTRLRMREKSSTASSSSIERRTWAGVARSVATIPAISTHYQQGEEAPEDGRYPPSN